VNALFKGGSLQYANRANTLLGGICGKLLAITLSESDMPKVSIYCYSEECYTESFCIINSYPSQERKVCQRKRGVDYLNAVEPVGSTRQIME
jgi:hypothetical protein